MRALYALSVAALLPAAAPAQPPGEANREALKKLAFLEGKWAGEATIAAGPGREITLKQTEDVRLRVGGTVLVVEGVGRGRPPGRDQEVVLFNAMAVISYDPAAKAYRMTAHRADGVAVEPTISVTDKGYAWAYKDAGQKADVRYTMTLTDAGEWHEVGEASADGKTWRKTFEMTLKKVKE